MNEHILITLKKKCDDVAVYGDVGVETQRNALKEELQYYVLDFIYHNPEYRNWTMYGGSALRICHGLNRMSVDLDFEVSKPVRESFLENLKKAIATYFEKTYGSGTDFLTIKITHGRGVLLRFHIGNELGIDHPSKQVHVKIDLNHFSVHEPATAKIPINHDQLSFVITTYTLSTLMASKIAALFLRGQRGVGKALYAEKGRDIYDLLWYMERKIIPDLDYLNAKGVDVSDPRTLFDRLTIQMNKVSPNNLRDDLTPLFENKSFIHNWLKSWHSNYLHLLDEYKIRTVTKLQKVLVRQDFDTDNFSFMYFYETEDGGSVRFTYTLSDYWIEYGEGDLSLDIDERVIELVTGDLKESLSYSLKKYITVFYCKTEMYVEKSNRVIMGDVIDTKIIRMTADNLKQRDQIVLNKSTLLSCTLEDLLR